MLFKSLCQFVHKKLIAGKCPGCGHFIIDGRDVLSTGDFRITNIEERIADAKEAIPNLLTFLKHANAAVRKAAATLLAQIGPGAKEALPALSLLLQDQDQGVRHAAKEAVTRIEDDKRANPA